MNDAVTPHDMESCDGQRRKTCEARVLADQRGGVRACRTQIREAIDLYAVDPAATQFAGIGHRYDVNFEARVDSGSRLSEDTRLPDRVRAMDDHAETPATLHSAPPIGRPGFTARPISAGSRRSFAAADASQ